MGLKELLASFKRKWWLIVLLVLVGGAIGFLSNLFIKPVYKAETVLCIMQTNTATPLKEEDLLMGQYLIKQYSDILSSNTVLSAIKNNLSEYQLSEGALSSMIKTSGNKDSNVFVIEVKASHPEEAAAVANTAAQQFINHLNKITNYKHIGVLDRATVPEKPDQNKTQAVFLCTLLGFMIALCIIFITEYFDTSIRSAEEIENELNIQVIGIIPDNHIS